MHKYRAIRTPEQIQQEQDAKVRAMLIAAGFDPDKVNCMVATAPADGSDAMPLIRVTTAGDATRAE